MATVSIENLIEVSFDNYQKFEDGSEGESDAKQSPTSSGSKNLDFDCATLREQILRFILTSAVGCDDDDDDDEMEDDALETLERVKEEITSGIIQIINATLANVVSLANSTSTTRSKSKSYNYSTFQKSSLYNSVKNILDMMAHFTCSRGDGTLATIVLGHMEQFASVDMECMRALLCDFMKTCLGYLYRGGGGSGGGGGNDSSKKLLAMYQKKHGTRVSYASLAFLLGGSSEEDEFAWREECTGLIKDILEPRLTDKSQLVRQYAIEACGCLFHIQQQSPSSVRCKFTFESADSEGGEEEDTYGLTAPELHEEILQQLQWNMAHDPSPTNRCIALKSVPVVPVTIPQIVERVRDAKLAVRVEALNILKHRVHVVRDLSVAQRVEVLSSGLSSRYPATFHATTKMLCGSWMKCVKFDIVDLLDLLDPSVNEEVCVNTAMVIIAAASDELQITVDSNGNGTDNNGENTSANTAAALTTTSDVTLAELSHPEIREYKEKVLNISSISSFVDDHRQKEGDSGDSSNKELKPATVVYLRTMCDLILRSNHMSDVKKTTQLSKIVPDVTVLCDALQNNLRLLNEIRAEVDAIGEDEDVTDETLETFEHKEDAQCFVCLHLLKLSNVVDLTEEGSRRHFSSMIHRILSDPTTHEGLVEGSVHALEASQENEASFLLSISEVLASVIDSGDDDKAEQGEVDDESIDANRQTKKEQYLRGIEILSVALEKTSRKMSTNPILQNFSSIILSAITDASLGRLIREAGVGCLGRFVILMDEETIIEKFKPLLLEIAFNQEEKIEIRAQAMLAICDLSFMFERMLAPIMLENVCDDAPVSVSDLLLETLSCPKNKSLAIVAAECSTKLLFTLKLHDANIVAHLVAIYFDKDLAAEEVDEEDDAVKEVGSIVRLQQLLTIFFPAYSMSTKVSRDILLASFKPLFDIIHQKMSIKVKGRRKAVTFPIAKMVQYICHNLENEDLVSNSDADTNESDTKYENEDNDKGKGKEDEGASPVLMASIAICEFLNERGDEISTTYLRNLAKILSKSFIDIDREDSKALKVLKNGLDDLAMKITDDNALKSLEPLIEIVADVESDDEASVKSMESIESRHSQVESSKEMSYEEECVSTSIASDDGSVNETVNISTSGLNDDSVNVGIDKSKTANELPSFATVGDLKSHELSGGESEDDAEEVDEDSNEISSCATVRKESAKKKTETECLGQGSKSRVRRVEGTRSRTSNQESLPVFASLGSRDSDNNSGSACSSSSSNDSFSSYGDDSTGDSD